MNPQLLFHSKFRRAAGHGHGCLCCQTIQEVASQSEDLDFTGVGSSPIVGDMGGPGVRVPEVIVNTQDNRYLIRLCGFEIPAGYASIIRGLRQAATLRGIVTVEAQQFFRERPITTPFWHPDRGNISWHLRWQKNQSEPQVIDPAQVAGTSPEMRGLDPVTLYTPPFVPYVAPAAGLPPGSAIGDYGTFHDIRFPWDANEWTMSELIVGPGVVVFYASVHQRVLPAGTVPPLTPGMVPEDEFLSSFQSVVYGRVAGAIIFELFPCCEGEVSP